MLLVRATRGDVGIEVVDEARDVDELHARVLTTKPDAVIIDIRIPPTFTDEGLFAAAQLRRDLLSESPGSA